ncbi:MAG TPA: cytochrome c [Gammaproteobacteria bacterium]|nr:cytochrome c [Gammaproteobacteria bacterium]
MSLTKQISLFSLLLLLAAGLIFYITGNKTQPESMIPVTVKVPKLSFKAANGKILYDANCAACHGANGAGTQSGPPFVHTIYNPGHHDDAAFYRAASQGVQSHHWKFGNMPPRPDVTRAQIKAIVTYVRELQLANGITYKKHTM